MMEGRENEVCLAASDPDIIVQSDEYNDRDVYFRSRGNGRYTKVIVSLSSNYGDVITAFPARSISGNVDMKVIKYVKP